MRWRLTGLGLGGTPRRPNRPTTTWPSNSGGSSSPPDFATHALSRPPRKKPKPSSRPVAALVAAGYRVFAVDPRQAARFRGRHSVSGAKSDTADAHVLADMVCTDARQLRVVAGDTDLAEAIKVLARGHRAVDLGPGAAGAAAAGAAAGVLPGRAGRVRRFDRAGRAGAAGQGPGAGRGAAVDPDPDRGGVATGASASPSGPDRADPGCPARRTADRPRRVDRRQRAGAQLSGVASPRRARTRVADRTWDREAAAPAAPGPAGSTWRTRRVGVLLAMRHGVVT